MEQMVKKKKSLLSRDADHIRKFILKQSGKLMNILNQSKYKNMPFENSQ